MHIFQHPPADRALQLLRECGLPTSDLNESSFEHFLACGDEIFPVGIIGVEIHAETALLRSLAVHANARASGCGKALVEKLEALAQTKGVRDIYLLTNTAERFFARLGYQRVERHTVPLQIKATQEFSRLCPDDATVMKKTLIKKH